MNQQDLLELVKNQPFFPCQAIVVNFLEGGKVDAGAPNPELEQTKQQLAQAQAQVQQAKQRVQAAQQEAEQAKQQLAAVQQELAAAKTADEPAE